MVGKAAAAALHGVSSRCGADAFASAPARHPHPQFGAARVRLQPFAVGQLGGDLASVCAPSALTSIRLERF
jgi:hypothetical protein